MDKSLASLPDGIGLVVSLVVALLTLGGIYLRTKTSPTKRRVFALLAGFGITVTLGVAALEAMRWFSGSSANGPLAPAPDRAVATRVAPGEEHGAPPVVDIREPITPRPTATPAAAGQGVVRGPKADGIRNVVNSNNRMTKARVTNAAVVSGNDNVINSGNVVSESVVVNSADVNGDNNVTNSGNVTSSGALTNGAELGRR